jgi:hypothetical protein
MYVQSQSSRADIIYIPDTAPGKWHIDELVLDYRFSILAEIINKELNIMHLNMPLTACRDVHS